MSPWCHVKGDSGLNRLDDDSRIGNRCSHVGRFDGSCDIYNFDADGSLIHGYAQ